MNHTRHRATSAFPSSLAPFPYVSHGFAETLAPGVASGHTVLVLQEKIFTILPAYHYGLSGLSMLCSLFLEASPPTPDTRELATPSWCRFKVPQPSHSCVTRLISVLFQPPFRTLSSCHTFTALRLVLGVDIIPLCFHSPSQPFLLSHLHFFMSLDDLQRLSTKDLSVPILASASERTRGTMNRTATQQRQDPIATPRNTS